MSNGSSASVRILMSRYTKDQCGTLACMNLCDLSTLEPVSVFSIKESIAKFYRSLTRIAF
jgi:hypothetical protein